MWLGFALFSALFLGLYDVAKKQSLKENAVIPVLWLHTLFCSLIMLPFTLLSARTGVLDGSIFHVPVAGWELHRMIILKAAIVLGSWIFGYFGMKHLPITLFGPINATRPIIVLLGGLLLFGERLNLYQWIGVLIAVFSFYLLSVSGKKEGITFSRNKWVFCVIMATILGAVSALFDKYLLVRYNNMFVQAWSNFYQLALMTVILFTLWWPTRKSTTPFSWKWSIILISVFLTLADYAYFCSLASTASMVSIVSMIRRSSVIVSFLCGALLFHEKNLKSKVIDLLLVLLGLFFLLIGSLQ
ncbi:MAG: DMT family transporter [Bacteroidaceae bacterium]|nr:DMT family transporter [Bacteroidaceae bacterium]MBO7589181.1 DMT family transporter [Bacteroidaceae bacterium]MBP5646374.1 DMT family transporter [Bacteroidaceae bacterium]